MVSFNSIKNLSIKKTTLFQFKQNRFLSINRLFSTKAGETEKNESKFEINLFVKEGKEKWVGGWLLLTAGSVFLMILVGGYTRLSKSGLSMTKWKPIAYKYPATDKEWEEEWENYKKYPEYLIANKEMNIEGFKTIFLVEYLHRYLGQSIGFLYFVPFLTFYGLGYLKPKLIKRCLGLLALGASQGLIGWWMVKSGFKEKPEYQSRPRVSTYRLFVHLNTAIIIYSVLFWNALNLLRPQQIETNLNLKNVKSIRRGAIFLIHLVVLNIMSGVCVAGIDAGKLYNTWPLMNNEYLPTNYWKPELSYLNFFENIPNVQFNHRNFGYLTYFSTLAFWLKSRKMILPHPTKLAISILFGLVNLQVVEGIITLLNMVPVTYGVSHQGGALSVLSTLLYVMHTVRKPQNILKK